MQPRDQLTAKEVQVATLVWEGLTNREIAVLIGTSEQVVKNYLRTTFDKLGVWSRLELALYVARQGGAGWRDLRNPPAQSGLQSPGGLPEREVLYATPLNGFSTNPNGLWAMI